MKNLFTVLVLSIILVFPSCKKEVIEEPTPSITTLPLLKSVEVEKRYRCTFEYDDNQRINKISSDNQIQGGSVEYEIKYLPDGRIDSILDKTFHSGSTGVRFLTFLYAQDGRSMLLLDHFVNTFGQLVDTAVFELSEDKKITSLSYYGNYVNNFYTDENRTQYYWSGIYSTASYSFSFNDKTNPLYFSKDLFGFFFIGEMNYLSLFLFSKNMPITYKMNNFDLTIEYSYNAKNQPTQAIVMDGNIGSVGNYYFSYYE